MNDASAPKVFISYCWTSDEHVLWVEKLATRLQSDGVEVVFDRWDLKRGHDKLAFMEKMVSDVSVTKVLAICDAKYAAKADGREGGVGTESQIISPQVYTRVEQVKFIPIVRELNTKGEPYLPTYFKSTIYLSFSDDSKFEESYDELLRDIHNAPAKKRPPLGKPPKYLFASDLVQVKTTSTFLRLKNAIEGERPYSQAIFDEYLDIFLESLEDFRIKSTDENVDEFDEFVIQSIEQLRPYRDEFVECVLYVLRYSPCSKTTESLISFFEKIIPFQFPPNDVNGYREVDFDNYRFLQYELFLYLIAACIRAKHYDIAATIIECDYHIPRRLHGSNFATTSVTECNSHVGSLEGIRNKRLKLNLLSVTASVIRERAPAGPISFREVLQADVLLYLRNYFPLKGSFSYWYPRCLPYVEREDPLEMFVRASTDRGIEPLKSLFRIKNRAELVNGIDAVMRDESLSEFRHARISLPSFLNLRTLKQVSGRTVG